MRHFPFISHFRDSKLFSLDHFVEFAVGLVSFLLCHFDPLMMRAHYLCGSIKWFSVFQGCLLGTLTDDETL